MADGPTDTIEYVLDPTRPCNNLAQTMVDGRVDQSYLWGGGNLVAVGTDEGKVASVTQDPLGSVSRILDEKGDVLSSFGYDEFGNSVFESDVLNIPFSYTGYLKDGVTQGLYAQARQYLPSTGQFMSADPLRGYARRPATTNRYSYCCQQPLDFVDLLGLSRQDAVNYAHQYATDNPLARNPNYPSFGTNCANFVSQCLRAGGVRMNEDWYCQTIYSPLLIFLNLSLYSEESIAALIGAKMEAKRQREQGKDIWVGNNWFGGVFAYSSAWSLARNQYDYFSNPKNGYSNGTIDIGSYDRKNSDNTKHDIQQAAQTVQPGDLLYWDDGDGVHHATIVTKVENGHIYYSGNTDSKKDADLEQAMKGNGESVHIVKLKDECFD